MKPEIPHRKLATKLLPSQWLTWPHRALHKPLPPRARTSTALPNTPNLRPIQNTLNYFPALNMIRMSSLPALQYLRGTLRPTCPNQNYPPWKRLRPYANQHQSYRPPVQNPGFQRKKAHTTHPHYQPGTALHVATCCTKMHRRQIAKEWECRKSHQTRAQRR